MPTPFNTATALSQINDTLANLGISSRVHDLSDVPADCHIPEAYLPCVLLDDSQWVFETYTEPLVIATKGQVHFVWHNEQTLKELVAAVADSKAKTLLLDGNLADSFKGWSLLPLILEACPDLICIGFSNDASLESHFIRAGAKGFAKKKLDKPLESLKGVVKALKAL
jgi:hypothetical protein